MHQSYVLIFHSLFRDEPLSCYLSLLKAFPTLLSCFREVVFLSLLTKCWSKTQCNSQPPPEYTYHTCAKRVFGPLSTCAIPKCFLCYRKEEIYVPSRLMFILSPKLFTTLQLLLCPLLPLLVISLSLSPLIEVT